MGPVGQIPTALVALGLVSVGVIALMLGHREAINSGPVLNVTPSYEADMSTIENETRAVHALINLRAQSFNTI